MDPEALLAASAAIMKRARTATLATIDTSGFPRPVTMAVVAVEGADTVWFATDRSSRKAAHIAACPKSGVAFAEESDSVTLVGTATVVDTPEQKRRLWQDWFIRFFPEGPDDKEYVLLCFKAQEALVYIGGDFQSISLKGRS